MAYYNNPFQVVADMAMDEKDKKAIERLMTQMESN